VHDASAVGLRPLGLRPGEPVRVRNVRTMPETVHLRNIRCDGSFHDGCQPACLMFWKEAWRVRARDAGDTSPWEVAVREREFVDATLIPATRVERQDGSGPDLYLDESSDYVPTAPCVVSRWSRDPGGAIRGAANHSNS
jgi:hypothetical protein